MEETVPNLSPPMCVNVSERRGRLCVLKSVERGHLAHFTTAVSAGEGLGNSMPSHQISEISVTL